MQPHADGMTGETREMQERRRLPDNRFLRSGDCRKSPFSFDLQVRSALSSAYPVAEYYG